MLRSFQMQIGCQQERLINKTIISSIKHNSYSLKQRNYLSSNKFPSASFKLSDEGLNELAKIGKFSAKAIKLLKVDGLPSEWFQTTAPTSAKHALALVSFMNPLVPVKEKLKVVSLCDMKHSLSSLTSGQIFTDDSIIPFLEKSGGRHTSLGIYNYVTAYLKFILVTQRDKVSENVVLKCLEEIGTYCGGYVDSFDHPNLTKMNAICDTSSVGATDLIRNTLLNETLIASSDRPYVVIGICKIVQSLDNNVIHLESTDSAVMHCLTKYSKHRHFGFILNALESCCQHTDRYYNNRNLKDDFLRRFTSFLTTSIQQQSLPRLETIQLARIALNLLKKSNGYAEENGLNSVLNAVSTILLSDKFTDISDSNLIALATESSKQLRMSCAYYNANKERKCANIEICDTLLGILAQLQSVPRGDLSDEQDALRWEIKRAMFHLTHHSDEDRSTVVKLCAKRKTQFNSGDKSNDNAAIILWECPPRDHETRKDNLIIWEHLLLNEKQYTTSSLINRITSLVGSKRYLNNYEMRELGLICEYLISLTTNTPVDPVSEVPLIDAFLRAVVPLMGGNNNKTSSTEEATKIILPVLLALEAHPDISQNHPLIIQYVQALKVQSQQQATAKLY